MKHREIGSEYHSFKLTNGRGLIFPATMKDSVFTFSGRTAIETVIKNEPVIRKVLLPSYCCESMIKPFRDADIEIDFYPVYYDNGLKIDLDIPADTNCILWCNYFGFEIEMPDFSGFISRDGIIIEDITHSLFSNFQYHNQSKYLVASVRKWEPIISGGYCASTKEMKYKPDSLPNQVFLNQKKNAMIEKRKFLDGNTTIKKKDFLKNFSDSNKWLMQNYSGLIMDVESLDFIQHINMEEERKIRRQNALFLYKELKNNKNIKFVFDIKQMDCPLFVPIIIENNRDTIKKLLIENDIYCPVHWPRPKENCLSNLYDMELSLICDQRYGIEEMQRIVNVLCTKKKYIKREKCYE